MRVLQLILVLLFPVAAFTQIVTMSEEIQLKNDRGFQIIGKYKNQYLVFRHRANNYLVQGFNEDLRLTWEKELTFDKKQIDLIGIVGGKKDFSIIYKFRKKGDVFVKACKYDAGASLIDSVAIVNYGPSFNTPRFRVIYSENRNTALLFNRESSSRIELFAFNLDNYTNWWKETITIEGLPNIKDYEQIIITDKGKLVYILEEDNKRYRLKKHHFKIVEFFDGLTSTRTTKLPVQGKLTYDVLFQYDNVNDRLVGTGLYSDKNTTKANGYFFVSVDGKNPNVYSMTFDPLPKEIIAEYQDKKAGKSSGINETFIQDIMLRQDGGAIMVAEYIKKYERPMITGASLGPDGRRYLVDYNYEDLLLVSVHPDGANHWQTILHKKQFSQDDEAAFSSYFIVKTPHSARLIFNDDIRNNNTVSEYVINGKGEYQRKSVLSTDNQDLRLQFRDAIQTEANEIILPSILRKRFKIVRIVF